MRAPSGRRGFRGRRLGRLRGYAGIGRWYVRRDRRKRRGCWRMYDRRRCGRAIRQEVSIERDKAEREHRPDHQEVLQDQHHPPRAASTAASQLSRARGPWGSFVAVCGYHDRLFPASKANMAFADASADGSPLRPSLENENPPGIFSRRAYVARALAPAGTSAVGSSVANNTLHIGRNHEYSMTTVRARRVQSRPLAPNGALG
jgi:hypothetical protein